jgi:hypothetical protein
MADSRKQIPDGRFRILGTGVHHPGSDMRRSDYGIQHSDSVIWTLDSGLWTLDSGLWTLDSGLCNPEPRWPI